MSQAIHTPSASRRAGDRAALFTRIAITDEFGDVLLKEAVCTNIGLGGLCVRAQDVLAPGTLVHFELQLGAGRPFHARGQVCWSRQTLYPALLGTPKGIPDDASFGIRFEGTSTQDLLPIARLLVAREDARRRASRLRRLHGFAARA